MARTLNGKLTGSAAREEKRDLLQHNHEMWVLEQRQKLIDREDKLIDQAINLPGFEEFWNAVPDFGRHQERIEMLESFIAKSKETPAKMTTPNWKVAEPNTLRAYTTAARDFETVTGLPADRADTISLASWEASMRARGLAVNTIRQRLSAIGVISGVKVQLPKREKANAHLLSAEEIRSIIAHVNDRDDRMLVVRLLTLGRQARHVQKEADTFMAHFLGMQAECHLSAQDVTRKLKRYARKAGVDANRVNLRCFCLSGRELLKGMDVKELVEFMEPAPLATSDAFGKKMLHGIGRRSELKPS